MNSALIHFSIHSKDDINIEYLILEVLDGAHGYELSYWSIFTILI